MADDKSKRDNRDRSKVSAGEDYEVNYLMTKYDLSRINHRRLRYWSLVSAFLSTELNSCITFC